MLPFLSLAKVEKYVDISAQRGVSAVARSSRGFVTMYRRANGSVAQLRQMPVAGYKQTWFDRRNAFVARHMAQIKKRGEPLFEKSGKFAGTPTRRHLALIMWAYSPTPDKL